MSRSEFGFTVYGRPAPQGSKTAYVRGGRAVMVESSKYLPEWRSAVMLAANVALNASMDVTPFSEPVKLEVEFFLERPKKSKYADYPGGKPDLDHLVRAVGDSLTQAGVLADDSLIVEIVACKLWTGNSPRVLPFAGARVYLSRV
jgi:Holliday junction resolvase RusA-like endonuclease